MKEEQTPTTDERLTTQEDTEVLEPLSETAEMTPEELPFEHPAVPFIRYGLYGLIVVILLGLGLLFYRFYPLTSKVAGVWEGQTVSDEYRIENQGKTSRFIIKNMNGYKGMDMVFKSTLITEGVNEYFVKDTKLMLELSYADLGEDNIKTIVGDSKLFKEISDNKKTKVVAYTEAGIKEFFPNDDLNKSFKYVLKDFKNIVQGETLSLRNDTFASGGVKFTRVEE